MKKEEHITTCQAWNFNETHTLAWGYFSKHVFQGRPAATALSPLSPEGEGILGDKGPKTQDPRPSAHGESMRGLSSEAIIPVTPPTELASIHKNKIKNFKVHYFKTLTY